ncbi:MAG: hydroxyacid dehydrogenase [Armatimonadetes bacterium]|nr:hydroxyacid dehydrogenase [Armatimonadota bacterium]
MPNDDNRVGVMSDRKRVLITQEKGGFYGDIFQDDIMADLKAVAEVVENDLGRRFTTEELIERARDCDAIITSWGSPRIDMSVVSAAPKLKIIAHAAGSVKPFVAEEVWDAGITVTNAASVMGVYVGEFALLVTLALLRSLPKYTPGAPEGAWDGLRCDGWETLVGKRVGLIGLGHTARSFVRFLAPFECELVGFDPYMSPEKASEIGVLLVSLEELLSTSKVVSLHAPITEETKGMLGAREFAMMQDGAVFVNTARGILVDHEALYNELKTGRIKAALDVTFPEPLPPDHPLRTLPNVILTPHVAGPTVDGRRDMFRCVVDDLKLFWSGKTPKNIVTKQMLATMA